MVLFNTNKDIAPKCEKSFTFHVNFLFLRASRRRNVGKFSVNPVCVFFLIFFYIYRILLFSTFKALYLLVISCLCLFCRKQARVQIKYLASECFANFTWSLLPFDDRKCKITSVLPVDCSDTELKCTYSKYSTTGIFSSPTTHTRWFPKRKMKIKHKTHKKSMIRI